MTYQRPQPGSILRCVSIGWCGRAVLGYHLKQSTNVSSALSRGVFMCVVVIILGCVCVLACPQCAAVGGGTGHGCLDLVFPENAVGTFAMVSSFTEKCIRQTLIC